MGFCSGLTGAGPGVLLRADGSRAWGSAQG